MEQLSCRTTTLHGAEPIMKECSVGQASSTAPLLESPLSAKGEGPEWRKVVVGIGVYI